jgi:hypothetical protein
MSSAFVRVGFLPAFSIIHRVTSASAGERHFAIKRAACKSSSLALSKLIELCFFFREVCFLIFSSALSAATRSAIVCSQQSCTSC